MATKPPHTVAKLKPAQILCKMILSLGVALRCRLIQPFRCTSLVAFNAYAPLQKAHPKMILGLCIVSFGDFSKEISPSSPTKTEFASKAEFINPSTPTTKNPRIRTNKSPNVGAAPRFGTGISKKSVVDDRSKKCKQKSTTIGLSMMLPTFSFLV